MRRGGGRSPQITALCLEDHQAPEDPQRQAHGHAKKELLSYLVGLSFVTSESAQNYRAENLARFVSGSLAKKKKSSSPPDTVSVLLWV